MKRAGILLAVIAALVFGTYGLLGTLRWQDAYRALGVVDGGPLAVAQAMAENDPPEHLALGERVHAPGTLMRLRYEKLDDAGAPIASFELRALVPPLPYFGADAPGSELGTLECGEPCQNQLAAARAVLIQHSGSAGLADEWLLRMPVGQSYSLGKRSLVLQDIGERRSRTLVQATFRVSVLEACSARLRIGAATRLALAEFAILPVPIGLRTSRWVQLEGCQSLMNAAPSPDELGPPPAVPPPPASLRRLWVDRADWESVRPGRSGGALGWVILRVDEEWLAQNGQPRAFHLLRACRYQQGMNRWMPLRQPEGDGDISVQAADSKVERVAYHFPQEDGLYFAEWTERVKGVSGPLHRIVIPTGGDTCRVSDLPPPAPGQVLACVPSYQMSDTALVPDPVANCGTSGLTAPQASP
jgi:hypothetical protein